MGSGFGRGSLCSTFLSGIGLGALGNFSSSSSSEKTNLSNDMRNKITILFADMKEEMKKDAIDVAIQAFKKYTRREDIVDIASQIATFFDKKYGSTWHCIVGNIFGISLNVNPGHVIYFKVDVEPVLTVVLFKYGT